MISRQTRDIESGVLFELKHQLGQNFVALVCGGSRASGNDLPDSDYDATCFVRDVSLAKNLDLSTLEERHAIKIGVVIRSWNAFDTSPIPLGLRLGRERFVAGRKPRRLAAVARLLPADWHHDLQLDWWVAVLPDLPSNILLREPRRHIGFIIAICEQLLQAKGISVKKKDLPQAMKRHFGDFHIIGLLRRALKRRQTWSKSKIAGRELKSAERDVKKFLSLMQIYAFPSDGSGLTEREARKERERLIRGR